VSSDEDLQMSMVTTFLPALEIDLSQLALAEKKWA
jgi:hypothetical protein